MTLNDFEKILLSEVDESFSSFEDSSKQAVFFHLESTLHNKSEGNVVRTCHLQTHHRGAWWADLIRNRVGKNTAFMVTLSIIQEPKKEVKTYGSDR